MGVITTWACRFKERAWRQREWCGKGHLTEACSLWKWSVPNKPTGNQENSFPKFVVLSQNSCWCPTLIQTNRKQKGRKMVMFIPVTGAEVGEVWSLPRVVSRR